MKTLLTIIFTSFLLTSLSAHARNEYKEFSIADLKALESYQNRVGNEVKFYFGATSQVKIRKKFGEWPSLKKTNAFNKTDEFACQWAMMSALISLKKRALREGGNAVFIQTNNDHRAKTNPKMFECEVGNIIASVAVIGKVVKI
jgi:hypothetical protein